MKLQEIIDNEYTRKIGFLCRAINFLEDVLEDAECDEIRVERNGLERYIVVLEPVKCRHDVAESIRAFRDQYDLEVLLDLGNMAFNELYEHVINYYVRTLHSVIKRYALETDKAGIEYYLGVLFNGKGFIIEGEKNKVIMPGNIPQCISAHTHPLNNPIPSKDDVKFINAILVNRGIGHIIETSGSGIAIYRAGPLSISDYEFLRRIERYGDTYQVMHYLTRMTIVKTRYI
ncbi:MAG: hypothetical protein QXW41_07740 [Fervidicoccaceae archaeon]